MRSLFVVGLVVVAMSVSSQASIITTGIENSQACSNTDLLQTSLSGTPVLTGIWTGQEGGGTGAPACFYDGVAIPAYYFWNNPYLSSYACANNNATITFTLDTAQATTGFDITKIDIWHGWKDSGRDGMQFMIEYATIADPNGFINYGTSSFFNPNVVGASSITDTSGTIAANVVKLRITVVNPENGYGGLSEFDIVGTAAVPEPATMSLLALGGLAMSMLRRRRTA